MIDGMRRTATVVALLSALDTRRWRYVAEVVARTCVDSSTASRVLRRFEAAGLVESYREPQEEARNGFTPTPWQRTFDGFAGVGVNRARRRFYRLTDAGVRLADEWREPGGG